jgi:hypothetical protein
MSISAQPMSLPLHFFGPLSSQFSGSILRVFLAMLSEIDEHGVCSRATCSIRALAKRLGMGRNTVKKAVFELKTHDLIEGETDMEWSLGEVTRASLARQCGSSSDTQVPNNTELFRSSSENQPEDDHGKSPGKKPPYLTSRKPICEIKSKTSGGATEPGGSATDPPESFSRVQNGSSGSATDPPESFSRVQNGSSGSATDPHQEAGARKPADAIDLLTNKYISTNSRSQNYNSIGGGGPAAAEGDHVTLHGPIESSAGTADDSTASGDLLAREERIPATEIHLVATTAAALGEMHNVLRRELGARPLLLGAHGSRIDAIKRAVIQHPPKRLAEALRIAAFVAAEKKKPQILDHRVWCGYRNFGPPEIEEWLETTMDAERERLRGHNPSQVGRAEPSAHWEFAGGVVKL